MSVVSSSVWPSGGASATCRVAITELPPGLLSTSTGTPRIGVSRSARLRATTSVPPPGPNGTTMRTGWDGNSAAPTSGAAIIAAAASNVDNQAFISRRPQPVVAKSGARRSPNAVMPSRAAAVQATAPNA